MNDEVFDLIVIGAGMGGLATASLARRLGLRTALLESHTKVGGCAGFFQRGPYLFDAGATALMGLERGEPIGDLAAVLDVGIASARSSVYRVHLPDRVLDLGGAARRFEHDLALALGVRGISAAALRGFWRIQEAIGRTLFEKSAQIPRLPLSSLADLVHDLRILGPAGILAGATSALTVQHLIRALGLGGDRRLHALVAMLLEDTAQAGPETVPLANASACLHAYRRGMSRPVGGMKAFVEIFARRFVELGGVLKLATLVDRVQPLGAVGRSSSSPRFLVHTRRGDHWPARNVAFNLPINLAAGLLGRALEGRLAAAESRSRATWSAFTGYLAIDRAAVPDDSPLFHQVLRSYSEPLHDGNNVLISLSPPGDLGYGPESVRVATLSTHTRPTDWRGLGQDAIHQRKTEFERRMMAALGQALPLAPTALLHAEFASPRAFARYTRRIEGAVGGPPAARTTSNFFAVGPDALGPGLFLVGDSVFPGQGTMAVVISAIRVVERLTGLTWNRIRNDSVTISARHSLETTSNHGLDAVTTDEPLSAGAIDSYLHLGERQRTVP